MGRTILEFRHHPMSYRGGIYRGHVSYVGDGDTVDLVLDGGRNQYSYLSTRLAGIDAPELKLPAGTLAKSAMLLATANRHCLAVTVKDREKFGRYLAVVYMCYTTSDPWESVNEMMVRTGHAVPFLADGIDFAAAAAKVTAYVADVRP